MRRKIFLLIVLLWAGAGYAQNYYQGHETVATDEISFNITLNDITFSLSNAANIYSKEAAWRYKDGSELQSDAEYYAVEAERNMAGQNRALREAFGDDVIVSLRKYRYSPLTLFYVVSPQGETMEVAFIMDAVPELLALPPSTFATLERKLKEYVTWKLNPFAQRLEFLQSFNFVFFKDVPLESESRRINPDLELAPGRGSEMPPGEEATEVSAE